MVKLSNRFFRNSEKPEFQFFPDFQNFFGFLKFREKCFLFHIIQISRRQSNVIVAYSLRWGWVFLERTRILSGIQFTTYFIEIFVVEMKRFVGSFVHVILTRQICGQRSSRAADSRRQALGNTFSERICYMFLISKCRGD